MQLVGTVNHVAQESDSSAVGPGASIVPACPHPSRIYLSPPHLSGEELKFVQEAFASNYIAPLGPMVDAFEREFAAYTGIPYCLALASGTAAMHLALRELGVGPGDEVVAASLTFIGSVSPATFLGASVVFLDSDRSTWTMDTDLLAEEWFTCICAGCRIESRT